MKRFKFNLEAVLVSRRRVEDQKLKDWSFANRFLTSLIDQRVAIEKRMAECVVETGQMATLKENIIGEFWSVDQFISGSKTRIIWKQAEIDKAKKIVDRKYEEYIKARQKREILEKLKTRRETEYQLKQRKHEAKILDDIYTTMHPIWKSHQTDDDETSADLGQEDLV
jgi:flagellar export protein FliJ